MEKISADLKRINLSLLILMVIILFGSCAIANGTEEPLEVSTEMETEKMVNLGDGYFGLYTGSEVRIYYYDRERNELTLKDTKYLDEDSKE